MVVGTVRFLVREGGREGREARNTYIFHWCQNHDQSCLIAHFPGRKGADMD